MQSVAIIQPTGIKIALISGPVPQTLFLPGCGLLVLVGYGRKGIDDLRPHRQGGGDGKMKVYSVYRVDYRTNKTLRIGKVVDNRRAERNNNAVDMLRVARKRFTTSAMDSHIFILRERAPGIF